MKISLITLLTFLCLQTVTYSQEIYYLKGSTQKIEQLVGDYDRQYKQSTKNRTNTNYKIWGTDLGVPFRFKDKTFILFGDIPGDIGFGTDRDPIAFTSDTTPEDGIDFTFITKSTGLYNPVTIPGISQGAFEVPTDGIEINNKMYIYHTTDHAKRSVLARSDDEGFSFKLVIDNISTNHFINISINKVTRNQYPDLPGQWEKGLVAFGTGEYRKSAVYMYCQAEDSIEFKESIYYFTGMVNQKPNWSKDEADATPVIDVSCGGELSTAYNSHLEKWMILYNCDNPRGILLRTADNPWGSYERALKIFEPWQDKGYCHFIHTNWEHDKCDSVHDPGRENEWGGEYGPYIFKEMSTKKDSLITVYYTMSTWNPYTIVLMKSTLVKPSKINNVEEKHGANEINVYPNPANDILYIKYNNADMNSKDIHINMYRITGSKVKSEIQLDNKVDIKDLDEGIYLIRINTNDSSLLKKIVVIR